MAKIVIVAIATIIATSKIPNSVGMNVVILSRKNTIIIIIIILDKVSLTVASWCRNNS